MATRGATLIGAAALALLFLLSAERSGAVQAHQCTAPIFLDAATLNDQENPALDRRYVTWTDTGPTGISRIAIYDLGPDGVVGTPDDGGRSFANSPFASNRSARIENGAIVWRAGSSPSYPQAILGCSAPSCATAPPVTVLTAQAGSYFSDVAIAGGRVAYIEQTGAATRVGLYDPASGTNTTILQSGFSRNLDFAGSLLVWQYRAVGASADDIYAYDLVSGALTNVTNSPAVIDANPHVAAFPGAPAYLVGYRTAGGSAYAFLVNGLLIPPVPFGGYRIDDVAVVSGGGLRVSGYSLPASSPSAFFLKRADPPAYAWADVAPRLPSPPPWASSPAWASWWGAHVESQLYGNTVVANHLLMNGNTKLAIAQCP